MKKILTLLAMLFMFTGTACAESFQEGKHYKVISQQPTSTGDKVEVLEFFWYGCPHCYAFETYLNEWKKTMPANAEFTRVPTTFRPLWTLHARAYYALQLLEQGEKMHPKLFSEVHNKKNYLKTFDALTIFVGNHGIGRSEFIDAMNSFTVESKVRKATKMVKDYGISGVPTVAINGKYLVSASMAGNYENMIKIMNYLIEKESVKTAAK